MWTIVRGGEALAETWEQELRWIPFADLVRESGTPRSFARLPSEESAEATAADLGGRTAEVLVLAGSQRGSEKFEIVLHRPPPQKRLRA